MDTKQKNKLERYLRNANRFIWGLGIKDQQKTYEWLAVEGFTDNGETFKHSYKYTTEILIKDYGIESIMQNIIKQRVDEMFGAKLIKFLRERWEKGDCPSVKDLMTNGFGHILREPKNTQEYVDVDPEPFLLYNRQFKFISGWGELAGVWFEEMEPYLPRNNESNMSQQSQ